MIKVPRIHYHQGLTLLIKTALTTILCLMIMSCTTAPQAPVKKVLTTEQQSRLVNLEYAALDALERLHFSRPYADSAEQIFSQMLTLDPNNKEAQRGIEQIVEHHIDVALKALAGRQQASAERALAHARRLDPQHPSIAPTENQLNLLANSKFVRIDLPRGDVRQATKATKEQLQRLQAQLDANSRCRFSIAVSSDDQGRFVYQLLKQRLQHAFTMSAAIIISSPNRVEGTCF
jgi:tetratricopeptide (TPR) repeat protein